MIRRIRAGISYANVVATLALLLALGGTSFAVSRLPAKSVGTKQLASNAVTSKKVRDRSLLGKDFKPGQLPAGATGPTGPTGPRGPSSVFQRSISGGTNLSSAGIPTSLATVNLPAGTFVVTGQATVDNADSAQTGTVTCFLLRPDGTFFAVVHEGLGTNATYDDEAEPTAVAALTLAAPGTISLACGYAPGASTAMAGSERRLLAVQVADLTDQ